MLIREPEVTPADFPAFQKTVKELRKQWEFSIYFPNPETNGRPEIQTLQQVVPSWAKP